MKIVCTGPECSGKTTLSKEISKYFGFGWVQEMARPYLDIRSNHYTFNSLMEIANLQWWEEKYISENYKNICCDTDALTIVLWSLEKYDKYQPYLLDRWIDSKPEMYLLCAPDIPWEYDPQRENPDDRERLFERHRTYLNDYNMPYTVVSGSNEDRITIVRQVLSGFDLG